MKALSLTQPWAVLLVTGAKRIETRSWPIRGQLKGPIAIHAAKGLGAVGGARGLAEICSTEPFRSALEPLLTRTHPRGVSYLAGEGPDGYHVFLPMPLGAIVGVAELVGCYATETIVREGGARLFARDAERLGVDPFVPLTETERELGDFGPHRFGFVFVNPRKLAEPIPCRGALGFWDVPEEVAAAITRQLGREEEA